MGQEHPYRNISLRRELVNEVEQYIQNNKQYSSITDFVTEAVRVHLRELKIKVAEAV